MPDRIESRAVNPIATCLLRQLVVPRIYFDADWPGMPGMRADVLAIDRDGRGDAHVVEIRKNAADALGMVPGLLAARSPFRWIAFLRGTEDDAATRALSEQETLYAHDSRGRVGVVEFFEMAGHDLGASVRIKAERFPTPTYELAAAFAASHEAALRFPE